MNEIKYRPEIDGLRAIAVMAVVIHHFGFGCPGGYVGVDVFFVLSGFLISSLILRDIKRETFSLVNFWERRVRRIFPALAVTIAVTLAAGLLLLPHDFQELAESAVASVFSIANVYFWTNTGYFQASAETMPLLHMWSLSVEEQFYVFHPFLLVVLCRYTSTMTMFYVLCFLSLLSLLVAWYAVIYHPSVAFYLLPTRLWELLLGTLISIGIFDFSWSPAAMGRKLTNSIQVLGIFAILVPVFLYSPSTPFPGIAAIPPCIGTALLIWVFQTEKGLIYRFLESPGMRGIGKISYSLYLWHWPILAYVRYWNVAPELSVLTSALAFAASFIFGYLSYRFVETPFRKKSILETKRSVFCVAGLSALCLVGSGLGIIYMHGFPSRFSDQTLHFANAFSSKQVSNVTLSDLRTENVLQLVESSDSQKEALLVWGDSHAKAICPVLKNLGMQSNTTVHAITHTGTPPLLNYVGKGEFSMKDQTTVWNKEVLKLVAANTKIRRVILVARWDQSIGSDVEGAAAIEGLRLVCETLKRLGRKTYILLQVPTHPTDVPKHLARQTIFGFPVESVSVSKDDCLSVKVNQMIVERLHETATILDPQPFFLDSSQTRFRAAVDGDSLYKDRHHLSEDGALLLENLFRPVFEINK